MSDNTPNPKPRTRHRRELPPQHLAPKQVSRVLYTHYKESLVGICGIKDCPMDGGFHGTPMCEDHAWEVWAALDAVKDYEHTREEARKNIATREAALAEEARKKAANLAATWKPQRWIEAGWVYYLSVGELVKIGYTTDMERRMKQYPPNSTLLAMHPGTPKLEREMHHKFLHLLVKGREWFSVGPQLITHMEDVRAKFPDYKVAENLDLLEEHLLTA